MEEQVAAALAKRLGTQLADAEWDCHTAIAAEEQWVADAIVLLDRRADIQARFERAVTRLRATVIEIQKASEEAKEVRDEGAGDWWT